ncbi:hypothetical protein O3M35_008282 [Rhynocoris fuscipes]|uniref:Uncharacterized protein n=1 Tax=Rhynocoris fuscipes TaxID=488301 RepID=A0AAW1D6E6_9HEMI
MSDKDHNSSSPKSGIIYKRRRTNSSPEEALYKPKVKMFCESCGLDMQTLMKKVSELMDVKLATLPTIADHKLLQTKMDQVIEENVKLNQEVATLKQDQNVLKNTVELLINKSKRRNLVIAGLNNPQNKNEAEIISTQLNFFNKVSGNVWFEESNSWNSNLKIETKLDRLFIYFTLHSTQALIV